jgi:hypothetical protein
MPDFFDRRDLANVTSFTDPAARFDFRFEAPEQLIFNESVNTTYEVSWDGENVHGRLEPTGPSKVINWTDHIRRVVFVRRVAGGPAGTRSVVVMAQTR